MWEEFTVPGSPGRQGEQPRPGVTTNGSISLGDLHQGQARVAGWTSLWPVCPQAAGPQLPEPQRSHNRPRRSWIKFEYGNYLLMYFSDGGVLNLDITGYADDWEKGLHAVLGALLGSQRTRFHHYTYSSAHRN